MASNRPRTRANAEGISRGIDLYRTVRSIRPTLSAFASSWRSPTNAAILLLAGAAFGLLVFFDLGPLRSANDDWLYTWSVGQLVAGHGLRLYAEQTAFALVQLVWGTVATLGHPDPRWLRVAALPFCALTVSSSYRIGRRLGSDRTWAGLSALALLCSPIFLSLSTSFMSDIFYVALLLAAAASAVSWIVDGRGRMAAIALSLLALLQRQVALGITVALGAAFLLLWRKRALRRTDVAAYLALVALQLVTLAGLRLAGLTTPGEGGTLQSLSHPHFGLVLASVVYFGPLLGLLSVPLLVAIIAQRAVGLKRLVRSTIFWAGLALVACSAYYLIHHKLSVSPVFPGDVYPGAFPGDYLTAAGLGPPHLLGTKPHLFPPVLFNAIGLLAVVTLAAALAWRPAVDLPAITPAVAFLIVLSLTQGVSLAYGFLDRYYLPVLAPLLPLLGVSAGRTVRPRLAQAWAMLLLLGGLVVYAVGEQDYQAWQVARDQAAQSAYQRFSPEEVQAGFEANGEYATLPAFERTGRVPWGNRVATSIYEVAELRGPDRPKLVLEFAGPDDPRPGIGYQSLAPGRVVLVEPRDP